MLTSADQSEKFNRTGFRGLGTEFESNGGENSLVVTVLTNLNRSRGPKLRPCPESNSLTAGTSLPPRTMSPCQSDLIIT